MYELASPCGRGLRNIAIINKYMFQQQPGGPGPHYSRYYSLTACLTKSGSQNPYMNTPECFDSTREIGRTSTTVNSASTPTLHPTQRAFYYFTRTLQEGRRGRRGRREAQGYRSQHGRAQGLELCLGGLLGGSCDECVCMWRVGSVLP